MQISHDINNDIEIKLSRAEAIKLLLINMRAGIEHAPSKTVPVTIDVNTTQWIRVLEWAKTHRSEIVEDLKEHEFEVLLSHFITVRGDGFNIL